eukprot:101520-Chlamydomonas_euryale.AAC.1
MHTARKWSRASGECVFTFVKCEPARHPKAFPCGFDPHSQRGGRAADQLMQGGVGGEATHTHLRNDA